MKKLIAVAASVLVLGLVGCSDGITDEQKEAQRNAAFERCVAAQGNWKELSNGLWKCKE